MAVDDVVNRNTDILEKDVPFDEEEAYYELCQIIAMAQQTGNYTRFQSELNQWKRHYPIESFSENYKSKIKYMLSEEFLSSILKDYLAFEKHSKMDPSKQLDKMRHIFEKAKVHKDEKRLDSDLEALYKDYPLELLKEKFPHIVSRLISSSYREEILQKFDYKVAYEEFTQVIDNAKDFSSKAEFEHSIEDLKKKYPLEDFSDEYRKKIEPLLKDDYLQKLADENIITLDTDDLTSGTVIPLDGEISLTENNGIFNQKTAYFELLEILKNPSNIDGVFNWSYQYMKYIGRFDDYHKGLIISSLAPYYKFKKQANYRIPDMDSNPTDSLSFEEYSSIKETKKDTVLQFVALISTAGDISQEDINRLEIVHTNSEKANAIQNVAHELDLFSEKIEKKEIELTPIDKTYSEQQTNKFDETFVSTFEQQEQSNTVITGTSEGQEHSNTPNENIDNIPVSEPISNSHEITNTFEEDEQTIPIITDYNSESEHNIEQNFGSIRFDDEHDFTL